MRTRWTWMAALLLVLSILGSPFATGSDAFAAGTGTLRIKLRGCPDGVDPGVISNPARRCDVPLDAPDTAFISYGGDGQGGEDVRFMDRDWDGTYVTRVPANRTVNLLGFEPEVRDSYVLSPVRDRDRDGNWDIRVGRGRTLNLRVYYYNSLDEPTNTGTGSSQTGRATLNMTFRGCPEGVNALNVDPYAVCTIPLDAPDASIIVWDQEGGISIPSLPRQQDGTYEFTTPRGILIVALMDIEPVLRNAYVIYGVNDQAGNLWGIYLAPGETRDIWVFYYNN